jgi:hypothetical protein
MPPTPLFLAQPYSDHEHISLRLSQALIGSAQESSGFSFANQFLITQFAQSCPLVVELRGY